MSAGATITLAQTFDDIKTRWRSGDYSNVLRPLMDWRQAIPYGSPAAQEVDYMLMNTMCAMSDYRFKLGCEYCQAMSRSYGASISFEGRNFSTAALAAGCCPPGWKTGAAPSEAVGYASSRGKMDTAGSTSRTGNEILNEVARALPITTILSVQTTELALPGDRITGYKLIGVDRATDPFWHWMVRLEVEYVYDIRHGSVLVIGEARGGALTSGYSHWGAAQEQAYGPRFRKGTQKLQVAIQVQQSEAASSVVSLGLQNTNLPLRTIITSEFPFSLVFRRP
jgi:hypothetical protein